MTTEETVELTEEQVNLYNKGEVVEVYSDENVEFAITTDASSTRNFRVDGKKYGIYLMSDRDVSSTNAGVHLFYDGKTKVYLQNTTGVDLQ